MSGSSGSAAEDWPGGSKPAAGAFPSEREQWIRTQTKRCLPVELMGVVCCLCVACMYLLGVAACASAAVGSSRQGATWVCRVFLHLGPQGVWKAKWAHSFPLRCGLGQTRAQSHRRRTSLLGSRLARTNGRPFEAARAAPAAEVCATRLERNHRVTARQSEGILTRGLLVDLRRKQTSKPSDYSSRRKSPRCNDRSLDRMHHPC